MKRLDYNRLKIVQVEFLTPHFGGDIMFVYPPIDSFVAHSKARFMEGMDKRFDGHVWTRPMHRESHWPV